MDTSASGAMPNAARSASRMRASCVGGSSEGVPPPKNTERSGAWPSAGGDAFAAMSAHTALTYSSIAAAARRHSGEPWREGALADAPDTAAPRVLSPTTWMGKSQ